MKKHILIFIPSIESGGVERNAIIVANELLAQGYRVSVLYCRIIEEKKEAFLPGVEMVLFERKRIPYINPRLTDAYFMRKNLDKYLREIDKTNAVLVAFQSASVAIDVCNKVGVKVICRLSNHPSAITYEKSMLRMVSEYIKPFTYRKADAIIANSTKLAEDFGKKIRREVTTIYNPISRGEILKKSEATIESDLEAEAIEYRGKLIIAVGRLTVQKDYDTLLKGFAKSHRTDTKLWIIGEGSQRPHLEEVVKELHIDSRVRMLGYRNNVYKYLKYGTIYILSSRYEGCPNSLIEASAIGLPCIASDCLSGPREVLLDGEAGMLFPVGDDAALAQAIDVLINDVAKQVHYTEVAMCNIERFDIKTTIDRYIQLIEQ